MGIILYLAKIRYGEYRYKEGELTALIHGAFFSDKGTRDENEDSVLLKEEKNRIAVVVADGLGGQGGGRQASNIAVNRICEFLLSENCEEEIHERFEAANTEILNGQIPGRKMMSTAVALFVDGGRAVWAHMGDSRLYHFINGKLVFQTFDHSVSQMAVFRGAITQGEIRFHEDRNRVLRALGGDEEAREETGNSELDEGSHAFLLCTDGFWEYVLETEMEQALSQSATPEEWLVNMCNTLQQRNSPEHDNFTAAAVFYTGEETV